MRLYRPQNQPTSLIPQAPCPLPQISLTCCGASQKVAQLKPLPSRSQTTDHLSQPQSASPAAEPAGRSATLNSCPSPSQTTAHMLQVNQNGLTPQSPCPFPVQPHLQLSQLASLLSEAPCAVPGSSLTCQGASQKVAQLKPLLSHSQTTAHIPLPQYTSPAAESASRSETSKFCHLPRSASPAAEPANKSLTATSPCPHLLPLTCS